ncbi:unnamed protein product [Gongylonema pulchrum]|uniref:Acyl-coenzyme A oxidase n=1 Tax=Gongylonema pulchrum TaxID=637853 RepID=A0A183E353_9BILA|nr:unnamed protein product [Gongylonema pulchrum]
MRHNLIEPGDNEDITAERRRASFSVGKLASFIHGGEQKLRRRREILEFVESQEEFRDPMPPEFMSREERVENNARKVVAMTDKSALAIDQSDFFEEGMLYQSLVMGRDFHAMSLHYAMFIPTLQGQTDDDQLDYWLPLAVTRGIVGTYAQTELGHGSNIGKLETTATYDAKTDEFILHTPSVSATKWWPGGLGKSSNYAIVPAQLIINGSNKGLHMFIAQLRDLTTHMPLPGVTVGDIGPKMGIPGNDNGFLIFNNYRIPRTNMLMRHSKISSSGDYVAPEHSKLGYSTMVFVRSIMIRDQALQLAAAVTIAIRYSAVRRQGELKSAAKEAQILDYRTQQYRILPHAARALVFLFAAEEIKNLYQKVSVQVGEGNTELLQELHVLSSGLKSVVSWDVAQGIEQCRLACGGHGYSHASESLERLHSTNKFFSFLMKTVEQICSGSARLAKIMEYLVEPRRLKSSFRTWRTVSPHELMQDFEQAARNQVFSTYDYLQQLKRASGSAEEAWNSASVELCRASRLHVKCYLAQSYFERIARCREADCARILELLGELYMLFEISSHSNSFRKVNYQLSLL